MIQNLRLEKEFYSGTAIERAIVDYRPFGAFKVFGDDEKSYQIEFSKSSDSSKDEREILGEFLNYIYDLSYLEESHGS